MTRELPRRELLALGLALSGGCLRLTTSESDSSTTTGRATTKRTKTTTGKSTTESATTATTQETEQTEATEETENADVDVDYPTGVEEDRVTKALALTHRSIVTGKTCTVTKTMSREYSTRTIERKVGKTERAYVRESVGSGTLEKWFEGQSKYVKASVGPRSLYAYGTEEYLERERFVETRMLSDLLETGKFEPVETKREGGTNYVVLEAEEKKSDAIAEWEGEQKVSSFEGSALVTEDGLIQEFSATYTITGERTETSQVQIETTKVGSTTVSKPSWTSTAKKRAPKFDVSVVDGGSFLKLEHVGGMGVPINMSVNVGPQRERGQFRYANLEPGIQQGETIYFYKEGRESLGYSRGQKPNVNPDPFEYELYFSIFARRLELLETEVDV